MMLQTIEVKGKAGAVVINIDQWPEYKSRGYTPLDNESVEAIKTWEAARIKPEPEKVAPTPAKPLLETSTDE